MGNSMAGMAGMSGDPVSNQAQLPPPELMATLTPFGKQRTPRGLQLTTTRLSKDGIAAVGAWWSAHNPVYQSISLSGLVSTISTPTPRGPVVKSLKSSKGSKWICLALAHWFKNQHILIKKAGRVSPSPGFFSPRSLWAITSSWNFWWLCQKIERLFLFKVERWNFISSDCIWNQILILIRNQKHEEKGACWNAINLRCKNF